jgi:hypothetical protein
MFNVSMVLYVPGSNKNVKVQHMCTHQPLAQDLWFLNVMQPLHLTGPIITSWYANTDFLVVAGQQPDLLS